MISVCFLVPCFLSFSDVCFSLSKRKHAWIISLTFLDCLLFAFLLCPKIGWLFDAYLSPTGSAFSISSISSVVRMRCTQVRISANPLVCGLGRPASVGILAQEDLDWTPIVSLIQLHYASESLEIHFWFHFGSILHSFLIHF